MEIREKEPYQTGERVRDSRGREGTVKAMNLIQATRRVVWDDGRTTSTHIADLHRTVD